MQQRMRHLDRKVLRKANQPGGNMKGHKFKDFITTTQPNLPTDVWEFFNKDGDWINVKFRPEYANVMELPTYSEEKYRLFIAWEDSELVALYRILRKQE